MKLLISCILFCMVSGCLSIEPKVETVKPWEGHFYTVEEFRNATQNMNLQEGESVWVLNNNTLSRVLKDVKED